MTNGPEQTGGPVAAEALPAQPTDSGLVAATLRALPPIRGKRRIAAHLMHRAEARDGLEGVWRVPLNGDSWLDLPRQSHMTWNAAFTGAYEGSVVDYVKEFIEPDSVVLDVGASYGFWTVPLAQTAAACGAKVWTFEPNPSNNHWLSKNVALNGLDAHVTMRKTGLGDSTESLTLVATEGGTGFGAIALPGRSGDHDNESRMAVAVERLDDVELPDRISLMKIDVEGFELAALRGGVETIMRDRPIIFGEFSPHWLRRRGEHSRLRPLLQELGYDVQVLQPVQSSWLMSPDRIEARSVSLAGNAPLPANLLLTPR
jgi:FkbM family methyltransferase